MRETMLRYATEVERNVNEERGREKGTRKRNSEQQEGSASSAISYASMVHGMAVHGAVMHIMGGMCTCRRSQLFDTAAGRYTCRRYLLHASRMGLWLTPSFSAWFRPLHLPFVHARDVRRCSSYWQLRGRHKITDRRMIDRVSERKGKL